MKMILTTCLSLLLISSTLLAQEPEVTVEPVVFSEQELDQMLAPVALYPDTVLAHILIAATYPLEVVQAARWTERNPSLEGDDALQAVEDEDWDPSVKALVAFPDILQRMSEDLDWTQRLGDAFLDDEARITASIQKLRQHAYEEGNLKDVEHIKVVKEKETIVIEPAVREVVYVPYYDTRYIYGNWWWDHYPPVYWHHPHYHHTYASIYWGPRVYLSSGFFFSGFHWHNHHVVVLDRHYHGSHRYYSSRQVVRHRDAYRWQHNPRHRRGVDYVNPRTRDYFESRRRNSTVTTSVRNASDNRSAVVRNSRDIDNRGNSLRSDSSRRNADFVRDRLRSSNDEAVVRNNRGESSVSTRDDKADRINRQQLIDNKRNVTNRGNIKLRESTTARATDSDKRVQSRSDQTEAQDRMVREIRKQAPVERATQTQRVEREQANQVKREAAVQESSVQRAPERNTESVQRAQRSERAPSSNRRAVERSSGRDMQRSSRSGNTSIRRER